MNFKTSALFLICVNLVAQASCGKVSSILGEIPIGGTCTLNRDCVSPGYSECKEDAVGGTWKCACKTGFIPPADNTACNKIALIGEPCNEDPTQCGIVDATCAGADGAKRCNCEEETHVGSQDKTKCLPKVDELEKACQENAQCSGAVPNSACLDAPGGAKTCQCAAGFLTPPGDKTKCNRIALVGQACNDHINQCSITHASCTGADGAKLCTCAADTHVGSQDKTKCLEKAEELGSPCEEAVQCTEVVPSSDCLAAPGGIKTCQCAAGFIAPDAPPDDKSKCNKRALLGESCNDHINQCSSIGNAACTGATGAMTCTCNNTHVGKEDNTGCLIKANLKEPCLELAQCTATVPNAQCLTGGAGKICNCAGDFIVDPKDQTKCAKKDPNNAAGGGASSVAQVSALAVLFLISVVSIFLR